MSELRKLALELKHEHIYRLRWLYVVKIKELIEQKISEDELDRYASEISQLISMLNRIDIVKDNELPQLLKQYIEKLLLLAKQDKAYMKIIIKSKDLIQRVIDAI